MDVFQLPNVRLHDKIQARIQTEREAGRQVRLFCALDKLADTIAPLAAKYPLWIFTAERASVGLLNRDENTTTMNVVQFEISYEGEVLGSVAVERYFSSARGNVHRLLVRNDRILASLQNKKAFTTEDPKKAIAKVKKTFGRKKPTERLQQAAKELVELISYREDHVQQTYRHCDRVRDTALTAFVGTNVRVQQLWQEHLRLPQNVHLLENEEKLDQAKELRMVINDVRASMGTDKSVLIVIDGDDYIIRYNKENIAIVSGSNLPYEIRAKLGMLKLTENRQIVPNCGCRVSEEVFLIMLDAPVSDLSQLTNEDE